MTPWLAACSPRSEAVQTWRVGINGAVDELPIFVMQELGLDRKSGLALEVSTFQGGAIIIRELAEGRLDISDSVGTVPLLAATRDGTVPDRVVALAVNDIATPEHPTAGVLVGPRVRGWHDLAGQPVAVNLVNSLTAAALNARMKHEGAAPVRYVEVPFANHGLALASGHVAAAVAVEPTLTQSILRGDGRLLDWVIGGEPLPHMIFGVLACRRELVQQQPRALARFIRAHLEAARWIAAHSREASDLLARRLGIPAELGQKIRLPRWPEDGRFDRALWDRMQPVMVEAGVIATPVALERVHDGRTLEDVLR
jgi:NitT/TauT family transport system substrate-binding protein